jgi:hypothetical protein
MRRRLKSITVLAVWLFTSACMHYRVVAPRDDSSKVTGSATVVNLVFGALQPVKIPAKGCEPSNAVNEVKVSTNIGFVLITAATLGLVAPLRLSWNCAKQQTPTGEIRL